MKKALLVVLGIVVLGAYACCKVAGEADRVRSGSCSAKHTVRFTQAAVLLGRRLYIRC